MKCLGLFLFFFVLVAGFAQFEIDTTAATPPTYSYAFSSFNVISPSASTGFDMFFLPSGYTPNGHYLARPAAMTYTSTTCGSVPPEGCIRDVSIGKIGSTWWLAYTCHIATGWCLTSTTNLGTALTGVSPTWTSTVTVTIGVNSFAPEWVRNPDGTVYLDSAVCANATPHIAFVESDVSTFWKIYETHPSNCADFTASWSTPVQLVTTADSTLVLDPYVVCVHGSIASPVNCTGSSDTFYLWYIHLIANTSEFIQYSSSSTLTGTYTKISANGDWMGLGGTTQEGPHVITFGAGNWRMFYDRVVGLPGDLITGQDNYSNSTDSWATWSTPVALITLEQAKHGAMIPYP